MNTADRSRHAAVSQAIEQALAGAKPRPPAPAAAAPAPASRQPPQRGNDAPRAQDLLAILRGGQAAREAAGRMGLPPHRIPELASIIRRDIAEVQRSAALGSGRKKPPVDKHAMVPV